MNWPRVSVVIPQLERPAGCVEGYPAEEFVKMQDERNHFILGIFDAPRSSMV